MLWEVFTLTVIAVEDRFGELRTEVTAGSGRSAMSKIQHTTIVIALLARTETREVIQ